MNRIPVPLDSRVKKLLEREVDEALARLRTRRITDHRIHQARRGLKKARAALRLLRPSLGDSVYQLENVALRDAGRLLSPLRDAKASLEIFDALSSRFARQLRGFDLAPLHRALELDLVLVRRMVRRPSRPLDECVELLEAHRRRIRGALRQHAANETIDRAMKRIYRKGRKVLAAAVEAGTPEALHEWRKQVKYLLNAAESAGGDAGPGAAKLLRRAGKIADFLGEDHDLAALREIASDHRHDALDPAAADALDAAIGQRRRKLQKRAVRLGQKIYERKPGRFIRWLLKDAPSPA